MGEGTLAQIHDFPAWEPSPPASRPEAEAGARTPAQMGERKPLGEPGVGSTSEGHTLQTYSRPQAAIVLREMSHLHVMHCPWC